MRVGTCYKDKYFNTTSICQFYSFFFSLWSCNLTQKSAFSDLIWAYIFELSKFLDSSLLFLIIFTQR